jgi:hypothetical protein
MQKEATGCMKNSATSMTCIAFRENEKCSLTHILEGLYWKENGLKT